MPESDDLEAGVETILAGIRIVDASVLAKISSVAKLSGSVDRDAIVGTVSLWNYGGINYDNTASSVS